MTDDETNMKELEENMRKISMDGLTWGASKLVPVGYGISKLQVNLVSNRNTLYLHSSCFTHRLWRMRKSQSMTCKGRSKVLKTMCSLRMW